MCDLLDFLDPVVKQFIHITLTNQTHTPRQTFMHQGDTEQNSPGHQLILATRLIEKQGTSDIEQVTDVNKSHGSSWLTFVKDQGPTLTPCLSSPMQMSVAQES